MAVCIQKLGSEIVHETILVYWLPPFVIPTDLTMRKPDSLQPIEWQPTEYCIDFLLLNSFHDT